MISISDSLTIIFGCLSLLLTYVTAAYFNGRTPSIYKTGVEIMLSGRNERCERFNERNGMKPLGAEPKNSPNNQTTKQPNRRTTE
ncbi:predicted protein [Sclerotinia sclerotiorum 1980 UF-70]|uniref:Uncharacterized protein n=1 Tax=Sclerotinia sclerotiorum (strain ATCC 18683 / 1980 / Ss-1) TaxID=665079 RepID=A7EWH9_SCLS1|nr:predicted protein [Sclerotinia sclerotiorum 1980 UF-70]EDN93821.1 predicted protein [Sclerotinia sclerotiorum 1980 UF-70]